MLLSVQIQINFKPQLHAIFRLYNIAGLDTTNIFIWMSGEK